MSLLIGAAAVAATGCAKGPSGGPVLATSAPNRMTVTETLQQPLNPTYFYCFAFDDDDNSASGPAAIAASTTLTNGVVAGAFTVLVQFASGQFTAYRRTDLGNGQETLDRASSAFVTQPVTPTGNTITFTLNLDAMTDSGVPLFRHTGTTLAVSRLDVNFVNTSTIRRDPNDNLRKAFDAFGNRLANFYTTIDIRGTRTYGNADTVQEPAGDVVSDDTTNAINTDQLDIVDFNIAIQRQ